MSYHTKSYKETEEREPRAYFIHVAGPQLYYTSMGKNLQAIDKRTFAEKITDAKEERALNENGQGDAKKWSSRTRLQYYLTELCDFVQEAHPEYKTHTHRSTVKTAPTWRIIHKGRRMGCIQYGEMALNVQTGRHSLIDARLCGLKTCPVCAKIMANKNERRINAAIEAEQTKKESRDKARYKALGITLTVPNCTGQELRRELQNIGKSIQQMLYKGSKIKNLWYFAVIGLEVTRNTETGLFHPHAHLVIFVPASYGKKGLYLKQAELVELWGKYSHRKVSGAAQYIKVVKNIHQSVKYATKLVKLPFDQEENDQEENEDAAAEAEKEESLVWTGKPEFDAETLYWIETACKGLHMTKVYNLNVKIVEDMREATPEDVEALESADEQQVYLLQRFERLKDQIMVKPERDELLTKKALLQYKKALKAQKSLQSREAWERRRAVEAGARMIEDHYNAAAAAAAEKRDAEILADVKELAKAGPKGRGVAMKRLKEIQSEKVYREAVEAISQG